MKGKLLGLLAGAVFGFVIAWARVTDPDVIRRMLLLKEPDVFLLMGAAIVVAGVGVRLLRALQFTAVLTGERIDWVSTPIQARHVAGSVMFGAGWSVACTCPGPVAAMIGQGHLAGIVAGAGLLSGIALKHRFDRRVSAPAPSNVSQPAGL
jgi:uncharacterized membrane protein YedE/YeeE